jgi:hypothetical protein
MSIAVSKIAQSYPAISIARTEMIAQSYPAISIARTEMKGCAEISDHLQV